MEGVRPIPLVGRERELAAIEVAIEAAQRGHGGLVAITGEAGIGKTRLAEEAVARATAAGFTAAWGSGWAGGGSPALWPWQDILEQLDADRAAPLLDAHGAPSDLDPERFARFRAVARAITEAAEGSPLVIIVDDAHATDPGALLLTRFVVRSLRAARVLVLLTARDQVSDEAVADELADLLREGTRLEIGALDREAVVGILAWAGRSNGGDEADAVLELTGGNPLLVHEAVMGPADGAATGRVRRLLLSRLVPLEPTERFVLGAAALLGPASEIELTAAVTDIPPERVAAVREHARDAGLLAGEPGPGFTFSHGLLRDAVVGELDPSTVGQLHQRAAQALTRMKTPATVDRLGRIAHHRLAAAANLDRRAVTAAVEACREAARADMDRFAYESAATLLARARDLAARAGTPLPVRLRLELAQAELAGGRLQRARAAYDDALANGADHDPALLAEVAIGLGGIWVFEHRDDEAIARYHGLLRQAASGVADLRPDLEARLLTRLAAEEVYAGVGSIAAVREQAAEVRAAADPRGVAEALSLLHHVLLGPEHAAERGPLADEIVATASAAGDAVLALMGVMWQTVDQLLVGDPAAERALAQFRQRADALRVRAVLYIVGLIDAMLLLRTGRVDAAEAAADQAFAVGADVGDADAVAYYGAALLAIRWLQDRSSEILSTARDIAASPTLVPSDQVYGAGIAALAADAGEVEEARRELDRIMMAGLDNIRSSSNWLVTMFCVVEAAAALGDREAAAAAYERLLPYAALPTMASLGVVCFGPTERTLGIAARTAGRVDDAVEHLERAIEDGRRLGNRPMLALARADLGLTLMARGRAGDEERGRALVEEGAAALESMGLHGRAGRVRDAVVEGPAPIVTAGGGRLRGTGDTWEISAGDERAVVADSLGMGYLARLLAHPGQEFGADELAGSGIETSPQEVLDEQALRAYRTRMAQLRHQLDDAEENLDHKRADRLRDELDQLVEHVEAEIALGNRSRTFADPRERARTAVQKAVRRAIARIAAGAPNLGDALARSVRTGLSCRFDPVDDLPSHWDVTLPSPAPR